MLSIASRMPDDPDFIVLKLHELKQKESYDEHS